MFWPRQQQRRNLDVLIAGCDTIQAAIFALQGSTATVVGIDVSESSLEHAQRLIDKYQLNNLSLHRLPIEDVACLGHQFDLIECTGFYTTWKIRMRAYARCEACCTAMA